MIRLLNQEIRAVVIGTSAGGVEAINHVFREFKAPLPVPILVVIHLAPYTAFIRDAFRSGPDSMVIKEAEDKEPLQPGVVYFAPSGYHLLVEKDESLSLSAEEPVQYSRPSIDVLFETAADCWGPRCLGILLTGANQDGAQGLRAIHQAGGLTFIQNPITAQAPTMPQAAISLFKPTRMVTLDEIGPILAGQEQT